MHKKSIRICKKCIHMYIKCINMYIKCVKLHRIIAFGLSPTLDNRSWEYAPGARHKGQPATARGEAPRLP